MKINIAGTEFESGNITREKYREFREVYESFIKKDHSQGTFTDEDLDKMLQTIVTVFENQFTFEQADDSLEEVSDIILNFYLINAELASRTNLQIEKIEWKKDVDSIKIGGKLYSSGKVGRKKYREFREIYEKVMTEDKETYSDQDLDDMILAIVKIHDNQFSTEEAEKEFNDVSEIIFQFAMINAKIIKRIEEQSKESKKNLTSKI